MTHFTFDLWTKSVYCRSTLMVSIERPLQELSIHIFSFFLAITVDEVITMCRSTSDWENSWHLISFDLEDIDPRSWELQQSEFTMGSTYPLNFVFFWLLQETKSRGEGEGVESAPTGRIECKKSRTGIGLMPNKKRFLMPNKPKCWFFFKNGIYGSYINHRINQYTNFQVDVTILETVLFLRNIPIYDVSISKAIMWLIRVAWGRAVVPKYYLTLRDACSAGNSGSVQVNHRMLVRKWKIPLCYI